MKFVIKLERIIYNIILWIINVVALQVVGRIAMFICPSLIKQLMEKTIQFSLDDDNITMNDEYNFFLHSAFNARYGISQSYVKGYFDCERLDAFWFNLCHSEKAKYVQRYHPYAVATNLLYKLFDHRIGCNAWEMGGKHYDIGLDLYESFLGSTMSYSCAYWDNASNLDEAQNNKMHLIAKKLNLKPGMRVLDIGCGYGSLAKFLSLNYDVKVVGCTVSVEHANYAKEFCMNTDVEIRLDDYRNIDEKFDRIVAVEMLEHIGVRNYKCFFERVRNCLTDDGLFLLHVIGMNHSHFEPFDRFLNDHLYLNMHFPSVEQIAKNSRDLLVIEDWQNMGHDMSLTFDAWFENFDKSWPSLQDKYGPEFYRLWTHYLKMGSGGFKARRIQIWHIVFSKDGLLNGYRVGR